ncbi:10 kDa heat shock protein, mitochondrial isoform X2 [Onthophagus taurus]|uniref:10 kDa heat shock protein, mitochondrial isoform X2 n=1 Tax=Onthophagus taurus TaxID=166361 RepID=UPI000C20D71D|nr:10 kDa heat shock protein, mitochondrial isoform X2 [Onthophagus taurus]
MAGAAAKKFFPMMDRVLVKKFEAMTKTKGGIVIPEKATAKVLKATVVAVGQGSRNQQGEFVPLTVKVGDNVLLPEYGGTKVEIDENTEYHLYRESEILAKFES